MSRTSEEILARFEAMRAKSNAAQVDLVARQAKLAAQEAEQRFQEKTFLLDEARTRIKEKEQAQASQGEQGDPVGDVGRAITPNQVQLGREVQGITGGMTLEGTSGGAAGGQAAQQALRGNAPTQPLVTNQRTTGLQQVDPFSQVRASTDRSVVREEFTPGQLTQAQAIQAQRLQRNDALERRDQVVGELANIMAGPAGDFESGVLLRGLSQLDDAGRQEVARQAAEIRTKRAFEREDATSSLGKTFQDIDRGIIPSELGPRAIEAALKKGSTTVNLNPLSKPVQTEMQRRMLNLSNLRDQVIRADNAFRPEFAGRLAQAEAFGISAREQIGNLPVVGEVLGEPTPEQQEFLRGYRTFYNNTSRTLVEVLKEMSGATVAPSEAERLGKLLVQEGDSITTINTKINELMVETNLGLAKGRIWQVMGAPQGIAPWELSALDVGRHLDNAADAEMARLRSVNPNASDVELSQRAVAKVEESFNLTPGAWNLLLNAVIPN